MTAPSPPPAPPAPDRLAERTARVRAVLDDRYPSWAVGPLTPVGAGLDAAVFRAPTAAFGEVAIRVPWARWISNDNDRALDARALLAKEELLANHLHAHGVPTPRAFALHRGDDDLDFLVSAYVPDDDSAEDPAALGAVVRACEPNLHLVECFDRAHNTCPIAPVCGLMTVLAEARAEFMARLDACTLDALARPGAGTQKLLQIWRRTAAAG